MGFLATTLRASCAVLALAAAAAATNVSGTIAANTTWTLAGSPWHVTGAVTVNSGVTLTVEPGVSVIFDGNHSLVVNGALVVNGTAGSHVTFQGTGASAGQWQAIRLQGALPSTLNYTDVRHGGSSSAYGSVYVNGATVALNQCSIQTGLNDGLLLTSGAQVAATDLGISGCNRPVNLGSGDVGLDLAGTVALAANTVPQIYCGFSSLSADMTLDAADVAYFFAYSVTVPASRTLTLGPGTGVKLTNSASITVDGSFRSLGSALSPNLITSIHDDNLFGDTNGNGSATSPAAGNWQSVRFNDGSVDATCQLQHTTVRFGTSSLYTVSASPTLDHCLFTNSTWPVHLTGVSNPTIHQCTFGVATNTPIYMSLSSNPVMTDNDFSTSNNGNDAIGIIRRDPDRQRLPARAQLHQRAQRHLPVLAGSLTVPAGLSADRRGRAW
jgi:hypothetical protein